MLQPKYLCQVNYGQSRKKMHNQRLLCKILLFPYSSNSWTFNHLSLGQERPGSTVKATNVNYKQKNCLGKLTQTEPILTANAFLSLIHHHYQQEAQVSPSKVP